MKIKTIFLSLLLSISLTSYCLSQTSKVTVKLHSIEGYGENEQFARKAAKLLEDVLNSDEFENRVKRAKFTKTRGLTSNQLFDRIMRAREKHGPGGEDKVIDLRLRTLKLDGEEADWKDACEGATIGTHRSGTGIIRTCPNKLEKYARENDLAELAAHYAHEYGHILGFSHSQGWFEPDTVVENSFVYQVGDFVYDLARK